MERDKHAETVAIKSLKEIIAEIKKNGVGGDVPPRISGIADFCKNCRDGKYEA